MQQRNFLYWVRYFIVLFVCFVVAMTLSFYLVQYLVRDMKVNRIQQEITRLQGEQIRGHSNYLVDLTHQYLRSIPDTNGPLSPRTREWLKMVYRPQLEDYNTTLLAVSTPASRHVQQLRSAADRALIMALHPESATVRAQSLFAISEAVQGVETYLGQQGYSANLQANALEPNWTDSL